MSDAPLACFGCGALLDPPPPGPDCPACGAPLHRPSVLKGLGLGDAGTSFPGLDAAPPEVAAAAADPANRLDPFVLVEPLGEGAAGVVHRAWDLENRRWVALKVLRTPTRSAEARAVREAQSALRLSHPNIVKIHRAGSAGPVRYLAMELVRGTTLASLLADRRKPPLRELVALVRTVALAVQHAHDQGVVHRDLKPLNLLVGEGLHPYVVDFGLARPTEEGWTVTLPDTAIGTPSYMSPEQVRGGAPASRPAVDVYALGAILYHVLAGKPPFGGATAFDVMEAVTKEPPDPLPEGVPRDLAVVALKALEKDPARRYGSARDFADDLGAWLDGAAISARAVSAPERAWRRIRRHPVAVLAVVALVAIAAVALVARRGDPGVPEDLARREQAAAARDAAFRRLEAGRPALELAQRGLYSAATPFAEISRRSAEARDAFEEAIAKSPDYAAAHHLLGQAQFLRGELGAAEASWTRAVQIDPRLAAARLDLARLHVARAFRANLTGLPGKPDDMAAESAAAVAQVEAALKDGAGWESGVQKSVAEALKLWAAHDWAALRTSVEEALARHGAGPGTEELDWLLGSMLDAAPAVAALDRALAKRPWYAEALFVRALRRRESGDLDGAIADYSKLIEMRPRAVEAYNNRGRLRHLKKEGAAAIADFDAALAIEPAYADALINRSLARQSGGDAAGARRDLDAAIQADPSVPSAWNNRGVLRAAAGDLPGAESDFGEALKRDSTYAAAWFNRGRYRLRSGREEDGRADLRRALELLPPGDPRRARAEELLR